MLFELTSNSKSAALCKLDVSRQTKLRKAFGVTALCLALSGCLDTRGGNIPYDPPNFSAPDQANSASAQGSVQMAEVISPLDKLTVRVFGFQDLSGDYDVDLLGYIEMPLIGDVKAVDFSPDEFKEELEARLGKRHLQNPDVSVAIKQSTRRVLTLDGAINRPGQYPLVGSTSLIRAIALGGGTALGESNPKRIAVFRTIGGKRTAAAFDLTRIRRGTDEDPAIYSGDIIVVEGSRMAAAYRALVQAVPLLGVFNTIQ